MIHSYGRAGLRRQFDEDVLLRLSLIALGQTAGFSLNEIASIVGQGGKLELPREQLRARADDLQRQMAKLRVLRDTLRHVADCKAPNHLECPTFRKLMKQAARPAPARKRSSRTSG